ncbi:hypothetical protein EPK99_18915 [Neorhizobium lilium]|uniref:Uncharacterized protein n=1 Tax=Neorhizobium lilium TaxID=2503024 RepID=A0A444LD78_9HYPH|nr:hypothetical protein [Neorhizobium lilium]RWX75758.1 hypothetical protein EPK99_18915 [Neorhizobium lilium]
MAAASLAVWQFVVTARYGVYVTLASMMDKGESVSSAAVANYASKADQLPSTCRTDLLNAAIAVNIRNVDQMRGIDDQVSWIASLRAMEPRLRQGLGCVPTDGLLWQRLAVVRWFLGGTAQEEAHLLSMSQAYAPYELDIVKTRILQWKRVTPAVIDLAGDALRSDIRITLLYAPVGEVKAMLTEASAFMLPLLSSEAVGMPPERSDALRKADITLP